MLRDLRPGRWFASKLVWDWNLGRWVVSTYLLFEFCKKGPKFRNRYIKRKNICLNLVVYKIWTLTLHSVSCTNENRLFCEWSASYGPPRRNPVTGDGVFVLPPRRRHPAASLRGADPFADRPNFPLLEPQPTHRYFTRHWPPRPADYYVESTTKPVPNISHTPYTLLGLKTDDPEKIHPIIDPDSLSPQLILDRHWPPFPAQHYLEPTEHKIPHHPLPQYAFVGMTSTLGDRPQLDYKYNPVPSLDGPIDPFLIANHSPPPTLFKYERDGPIPDFIPLETPVIPGPHTLTGFPPIFHKHVPGYLFNLNRHAEDFRHKTYYVDYVRRREMGGCLIRLKECHFAQLWLM